MKVNRRVVALTVGEVLALMPLATYAQTADHVASELERGHAGDAGRAHRKASRQAGQASGCER
jgi:hypothetical protein